MEALGHARVRTRLRFMAATREKVAARVLVVDRDEHGRHAERGGRPRRIGCVARA